MNDFQVEQKKIRSGTKPSQHYTPNNTQLMGEILNGQEIQE